MIKKIERIITNLIIAKAYRSVASPSERTMYQPDYRELKKKISEKDNKKYKRSLRNVVHILIGVAILLTVFKPLSIKADNCIDINYIESVLSDFHLSRSVDANSFKLVKNKWELDTPIGEQSKSRDNLLTFENDNNEILTFLSDGTLISIERLGQMTNNGNCHVVSSINSFPEEIIISLKNNGYIPNDYFVYSTNKYSDDLWVATLLQKNESNILNAYNSFRIAIDAVNGEILYYKRFIDNVQEYCAVIDEKEAIEKVLLVNNKVSIIKTSLEVKKYKELIDDPCNDEFVLAYRIETSDSNIYWIDAKTGELINIDSYESYEANAYYTYDNASEYNNRKRLSRAMNYAALQSLLGYTYHYTYLAQSSASRNTIINYLNGSDSWSFAFSGHGNTTTIAGHYSDGTTSFAVYTSDVVGVWSLVILDACDTAANSSWANAFQIYDYNTEGRSFIGWSNTVSYNNAATFSLYFYNTMYANPSTAMVTNMYNAIVAIPSTDIYYTLYIGDRTTTGYRS